MTTIVRQLRSTLTFVPSTLLYGRFAWLPNLNSGELYIGDENDLPVLVNSQSGVNSRSGVVETLTGNKNLSGSDDFYQIYDLNGTDRTVNLPDPVTNVNKEFRIANSSSSGTIEILENTVITEVFVSPQGAILCYSDGTDWNIFI